MFWLPVVQAAHATDVDTYEPSASFMDGLGTLQGESAEVADRTQLSGGTTLTYATDAVQQRLTDGSIGPAVAEQAVFPMVLSLTLADRVRISALVPAYAWVDLPMDGYAGGGFGDLRLGAAVPLWEDRHGSHTFGVVPRFALPTASPELRVSNGVSGELLAAFTGRQNEVGYSVNVGIRGAPSDPLPGSDIGLGSTIGGNAGLWWITTKDLRFGTEFDVRQGLVGGTSGTTVGMLQGFIQGFLADGVGAHVGAGASVIGGIGAPPMRLMAGISWTPRRPDADRDGVVDADDQCGDQLEDLDGVSDGDGCPDLDDDRDQVSDDVDRCPEAAEDPDGFEDADGCPDPDNDADGIADAQDRCPDVPGSAVSGGCADRDLDQVGDVEDQCPDVPGIAALAGCPDGDADGVPEPKDACPTLPLPAWVSPAASDGCPPEPDRFKKGGPMALDGKIAFQAGTSTLDPSAQGALEQLRALLARNPQIAKVDVVAHVDNAGDDAANKALTLQQAEVVVAWLVEKGIAADRLHAVGAGEGSPLYSNRTEDGRSKNRRVEVKVVEVTPIPTGPSVVRPEPGSAPEAPKPAPVVVPP